MHRRARDWANHSASLRDIYARRTRFRPSSGYKASTRLHLGKRINHQLHIVTQRVKYRAGAAIAIVLFYLRADFVGCATGGDALNQFVRHKLHGLVNLLFSGGPAENALHLLYGFRWRAAGLSNVRLLGKVLCNQFLGRLHRSMVIGIYRADDQLRAINVVQGAPGFFRADFNVFQGFGIVCWGHAIIEQHAVGDFACQLHHAHVRRADVDGHVARLASPVYDIELDTIHVMEFAVEGDALHLEQALQHFDGLAHGLEGLSAFNAHLFRQRVPPRADAADDAIRREVVERQEGRGEQSDVARPVVQHAAANFHARCHRRKGSHWYNCITHEARFGLPHGLEAALLGILGVCHAFAYVVFVLQVYCHACHRMLLTFAFKVTARVAHSAAIRWKHLVAV